VLWVESSDLLLHNAARSTRLYHNKQRREDCVSVRPYVLSAYLYDYTCVFILFLLGNLRSFSLCWCLCFATGTVIYTLGSEFNLDVNPQPLRVMSDISLSETCVTSASIIFHFL